MTNSDPKKYVSLIAGATLLAAFSVASIVSYTDPNETGWSVFVFFYLSVFLFSLGVFTLLGLGFRRLWMRGLFTINLSNSFRQALLLSLLILLCLLLSSFGLLFWWVTASLILPLVAIEAFLNLKI